MRPWHSIVGFLAVLLVAISSWGHDHDWMNEMGPEHWFEVAGIVGTSLGMWIAKSPLDFKRKSRRTTDARN